MGRNPENCNFLPSFVSWRKDELNCLIKKGTSILACIVSKPSPFAKCLAPQTPEICWSLKIWKLYDTESDYGCSDIDGREKKDEGSRLDREHKRREMVEKRCRHENKVVC